MSNILGKTYFKNYNSPAYENKFYKIMVEYLGDEIFVTDGNGKIIFVNPASVDVIGLPVDKIIGRTAQELQDEGYFSVSSTMEVLRKKKSVNVLQKLQNGKTVLATGVPVFDKNQEEIIMVISTCKDVKAINDLAYTVEKQALEIQKTKEEIHNLRKAMFIDEGFISSDPVMKELKEKIIKIAPLDVPVLIQGETGVGKEVVAKSIHRFSDRSDGPFMKINCGAIAENLVESELFGYEKGAFTGANKEGKKGKVEIADGGTLFLDEIGEMPLPLQVKLLDFLQDGTFTRVGGTERLTVNTRIVSATNRDLKQMSGEGTFRKDLFYRLNVVPIYIPPLRERVIDIDALSKYFISTYNTKYRFNKRMGEGFLEVLSSYEWPGNVRELENLLERVYIMSENSILKKEDLKQAICEAGGEPVDSNYICMEMMPLKEAKWALEKQMVTKAYEMYGSTYKAAEALQVDQSTVVKLLHKHNCVI